MKRTELENLILPVVLLLTGLILIGGDRVGILSLDRIQNLWPVAFILVGLTDLFSSDEQRPAHKVTVPHNSRDGARHV